MHEGGLGLPLEGEAAVAEELDAGVDDAGVVADAPALADLFEALLESEGRTVRPQGAEGLDDIGHGQNPGLHQDGVADESFGIARSVQPLMMLEDDVGHGPGEGDVLDHLIADPGMVLDELEFRLRQPAGLGHDLDGGRDFADVLLGRANGMQYFMTGKLKLAGDLNLAMKLTTFFKMGG